MLQLVFHIALISAICITWGIPSYLLARTRMSEAYWFQHKKNLFVFLFFSGLLTISFISSWLVLIIPQQFAPLGIATGIAWLVLLIKKRKAIPGFVSSLRTGYSKSFYLLAISGILLLVVCGTLPSANDDTQLYHLQIIRWLNEHGVVPGTANIYPRLGLGSNWFTTISIFHIPALKNQNFTFLNCTVAIWFLGWLINQIIFFNSQREFNSNAGIFALFNFLLLVYFLADWQLFRDTANSTSYDFIVTIVTLFCLNHLAESALSPGKPKFSYIFIILCFLIITFKLSGMFILVPAGLYIATFRAPRIWLHSAILFVIILTPVLIKNYLVTGYPLFPSSFAIGSPEWQLPGAMTNTFRDYIVNANRYYNHPLPFIETVSKTEFNWIPFWIKGITLRHKVLLLATVSSVFLFFRNGVPRQNAFRLRWFLVATWLMTAGWFFTAPDPRFGFGFLTLLAFLPISIWLGRYFVPRFYPPLFLLISICILVYTYVKMKPIIDEPVHLVSPYPAGKADYIVTPINGIDFTFPKNDGRYWNNRCYYLPLPCMCEPNQYLKPIGNEINDGFKLEPAPDSNFIKTYNY